MDLSSGSGSATPFSHFRAGVIFSSNIDEMLVDSDFEYSHDAVEMTIMLDNLTGLQALKLHFSHIPRENLIGQPGTVQTAIELMSLISPPSISTLCQVDIVASTIRTESRFNA